MKFYIAAYYFQKDYVRTVFRYLESKGHEITVDWTNHEAVPFKEREAKSDVISEYSRKDILGVIESDVFVILAEPNQGAGKYVELGAAIGCFLIQNKPKVYAVGNDFTRNIFFYHPVVKQCSTVEEVLNDFET